MRTGASDVSSRGFRGQVRQGARLKKTRNARLRRAMMESEFLEPRTLLATIPAAAATGQPIESYGLSSVTTGGNANSPAVVVDPYDSQKVFAVWGVDLSSLTPVPHTTAVVEGAYSDQRRYDLDRSRGRGRHPAARRRHDQRHPPDGLYPGDRSERRLRRPGQCLRAHPADQRCQRRRAVPDRVQFLRLVAEPDSLPNNGIVYQWVTGSDAATSPVVAVDAANPAAPRDPGPSCEQCLHRLGQHRHRTRQYQSVYRSGFNPNRAELVVGTPISNPSGNEESLAFSGVTTVNANGNFGPQDDSHPQLVINQNDGGQVTVAWDDFGTGAKASPAFDDLMSNLVQPGDSYGFTGSTGPIQPGTTGATSGTTAPGSTPFTDRSTSPTRVQSTTSPSRWP